MHSLLLTVGIVAAIALVIAVSMLAVAVCRAEPGFEDDEGFHLGEEPTMGKADTLIR